MPDLIYAQRLRRYGRRLCLRAALLSLPAGIITFFTVIVDDPTIGLVLVILAIISLTPALIVAYHADEHLEGAKRVERYDAEQAALAAVTSTSKGDIP